MKCSIVWESDLEHHINHEPEIVASGRVTSAIHITPVMSKNLWVGWLKILSLCGIPIIPDHHPKPLANCSTRLVGWHPFFSSMK